MAHYIHRQALQVGEINTDWLYFRFLFRHRWLNKEASLREG